MAEDVLPPMDRADAQPEGSFAGIPRTPATEKPAPAPYIKRGPASVETSAARTGALRGAPDGISRAGRFATTDYGYVVNELKRIALTGACLLVLLFVVARLLH
ncbi:MAG: hypothetical protein ACR2PL_15350 [Dehalococcoidia bacterium]